MLLRLLVLLLVLLWLVLLVLLMLRLLVLMLVLMLLVLLLFPLLLHEPLLFCRSCFSSKSIALPAESTPSREDWFYRQRKPEPASTSKYLEQRKKR